MTYLDIAMHYILAMAKVQCIGDGQHYLRNLALILAAVQVVAGVQFASLAELHDYIKERGVVVDLKHLDDIRMFKLGKGKPTKRRI